MVLLRKLRFKSVSLQDASHDTPGNSDGDFGNRNYRGKYGDPRVTTSFCRDYDSETQKWF